MARVSAPEIDCEDSSSFEQHLGAAEAVRDRCDTGSSKGAPKEPAEETKPTPDQALAPVVVTPTQNLPPFLLRLIADSGLADELGWTVEQPPVTQPESPTPLVGDGATGRKQADASGEPGTGVGKCDAGPKSETTAPLTSMPPPLLGLAPSSPTKAPPEPPTPEFDAAPVAIALSAPRPTQTRLAKIEPATDDGEKFAETGEAKPAKAQRFDFSKALEKGSPGAATAKANAPPPQVGSFDSQTALPQSDAITAAPTQAATHSQQADLESVTARAAPATAQLGREIIRRFSGQTTQFDLRLDPPELGRVEVRLEVSRDHRVTAVVSADNPQALAELVRHARELEQTLQSAGLELADNGLSFDLRQGGEGARDTQGEGRNRSDAAGAHEEAATTRIALARPLGLELWRGVRVDVMA